MRIVAGIYGGRIIKPPRSKATRPMTDKVRAALFDMLGDLDRKTVLDAYAGSGAVGIEALSRGASQVVIADPARLAIKMIDENLHNLKISWGYTIHQSTIESWLARNQSGQRFDLIVADPPYDQLKTDVLEKLGKLLQPEGILAVSHSTKQHIGSLEGLQEVTRRVYGDTAISLYRSSKS